MCIVVLIWQAHPLYPLFILQNRYESQITPSLPLLGLLIALLTNVLELHTLPDARSRGDLLVLVLESTMTPKEFVEQLVKEGHWYNGFNMVLADIYAKSMLYVSNMPKNEPIMVQEVSPGIHVLSNAKLDSRWHTKLIRDKVKADKSKLPQMCRYETRSSVALSVRANGEVDFYETYLDDSSTRKEHTVDYKIQKMLLAQSN
ncbi:hypothetical protein UlMin_045421 [Ulmus minor]